MQEYIHPLTANASRFGIEELRPTVLGYQPAASLAKRHGRQQTPPTQSRHDREVAALCETPRPSHI